MTRWCAWCGKFLGAKCPECGRPAWAIARATICMRLHVRRAEAESHGICARCLRALADDYRQPHTCRKAVAGFNSHLDVRDPGLQRLMDLQARRQEFPYF